MRATWKGSLRLERLVIPVAIASGHQHAGDPELRVVHAEGCNRQVVRRWECPEHGLLDEEQTGRAFEASPGVLYPVAVEELKALAPAEDRVIEISACVAEGEIDPLLVRRAYHLVPGTPERHARGYALVAECLTDARLVALGRFHAWQGEQLCAISTRPGEARQLMLRTLHPGEDLVRWEADRVRGIDSVRFSEEETELGARLLAGVTRRYRPRLLVSEQRRRVRALL